MTVAWLVTDLSGKPLIRYGMGNFGRPELLLFEHFHLEYLGFEDRGEGVKLPRRWRGILDGEDGCLEYEVNALGQDYDPTRQPDSFLMPNLLLHCEGQLKTSEGGTCDLVGVGLPEYHVAHRGPLDSIPERHSK